MRAVDGKATLDRLDLERCVSSLPEGQREVLILFDIQGYSHNEIAKLLEIAPGTSKSRLFEARKAMRRELGHELESSEGTL
jgi:RNA polymerase sigma factor (sigma-70 family)